MVTYNDSLFCILTSCENEIKSKRLIYYMYLYEWAGLDFAFKYKISGTGKVESPSIDQYLNNLVSQGYIESNRGIIKNTDLGVDKLGTYIGFKSDFDFYDYILSTLNNFTTSELHFIVITNMIMEDYKNTYPVETLVSKRDEIESTIMNLSSEFTKENFNTALSFLRKIKGGFINDRTR